MPRAATDRSRYFLQSLAKGLTVLQAMAEANQPMALSDIARAASTSNATATRICYTLTQMGFIDRDAQRRFFITPRILSLGHSAVCSLGWRNVAQHYLERLSFDLKETVNLSVLDGHELIYIARVNTGRILPFDLQLGSRLPVYCTSMGKVLVAFSPPETVSEILQKVSFTPLTHRTITDRDKYLADLERVRAKGYALNDEELSVGLRSVAAPIFDSQGWSQAAINIAVPTTRYSLERLENELAPAAMRTAREIMRALGTGGRKMAAAS
jgi:IclR family pca regulon transcriptional regulator